MQSSRKPSNCGSLVFATALAVMINLTAEARAQTPAMTIEYTQHRSARADHNTDATVRVAEQGDERSTDFEMGKASPAPAAMQIVARPGSLYPVSTSRKNLRLTTSASHISPTTSGIPSDIAVAINPPTPAASLFIESRSVACRAASEWMPAKQLRQHATATQELNCDGDDCTLQAANAIARFLRQQADHQQDMAAAIALRGYYTHAAINEQFELARKSVAALAEQRERQLAIIEKGFAAAIDLTSLDREAITLQLQRLQLEHRDRQVTESLNDAMRLNYDWRSSETEPLEVRIQSIDANYLVQFALTHRSDLLAIQCLSTQINSGTAPLLASVVSSASGMISLPLPKRCFVNRMLRREDNTTLANNLRESIALAYETQAKAIRREVSESTISLELAYQRITLSQEATATWEKRLEQLERLAKLGDSRPADLTIAQTSLLASQALQVERRLEAKLLEIALAEACGGLYDRCCNGQAWLITSR